MDLLSLAAIGFTFVVGALVIYFILNMTRQHNESAEETPAATVKTKRPSEKADDRQKNGGGKKAPKTRLHSQSGVFEHPWTASNLKGHSRTILDMDFSSNGKYLITCAEDRSLLLWNTNDFESKEHKSVRGNLELDHAKCVRFAPDSKSILLCLANANTLTVYKIVKKEGAGSNVKIQPIEGTEFPVVHKADIISIGIACNGKFVMSISGDTTMLVWDLKGNVLKSIDTRLGNNNYGAVSPCGRFVAASGFTPDVKILEVTFSKIGEFQDVVRAFELKGHSAGVHSFDFNQDSTRMVTASKDGTFRIWDTNIRYQLGQEPYLIASGALDELKMCRGLAAMSPNGDSFAIACRRSLRVYSSDAGQEEGRMEDTTLDELAAVKFSVDSRYLVWAGDKISRVFHNVAGYRVQARRSKEQMKNAQGEALKERLVSQLREADEICRRLTGQAAC